MTEIISTQIKNFTHYNVNNEKSNLEITVVKKKYVDDTIWYDIHIKTLLKDDSILSHDNYDDTSNPFKRIPHLKHNDLFNGEIVAYNSLTEKMIEYILMNDCDLSKYTGRTTPMDYRINLLSGILLLWD